MYCIRFRKIYVLAAVLGVVCMTKFILVESSVRCLPAFTKNTEKFRAFHVEESLLEEGREDREQAKKLAMAFLFGDGIVNEKIYSESRGSLFSLLVPDQTINPYIKAFRTVVADVRYFPVPIDRQSGVGIRYENSWGSARSYGGSRKHEGCDIMSEKDEPGYFPIISASDGRIEKKGWLELGGYRMGIRAPGGAFFYYAHMDSYEPGLSEGDHVMAGQILGYMGDSGYGKEGTKGKFDVHLHFGIYMDIEGKEISVNPYHVLKYLENHRKTFYRNQKM